MQFVSFNALLSNRRSTDASVLPDYNGELFSQTDGASVAGYYPPFGQGSMTPASWGSLTFTEFSGNMFGDGVIEFGGQQIQNAIELTAEIQDYTGNPVSFIWDAPTSTYRAVDEWDLFTHLHNNDGNTLSILLSYLQ